MAFAEEVKDPFQVLPPLLQRVLGPVDGVHVRQLLPLLHLLERKEFDIYTLRAMMMISPPPCRRQGPVDFPNLLGQGSARRSG